MDFKIALVKPVEFETSKLDPFRFDEYAEKAGGEFMPFATTARKPAYYFFIDYTNLKASPFQLHQIYKMLSVLMSCWNVGNSQVAASWVGMEFSIFQQE